MIRREEPTLPTFAGPITVDADTGEAHFLILQGTSVLKLEYTGGFEAKDARAALIKGGNVHGISQQKTFAALIATVSGLQNMYESKESNVCPNTT